MRPVGVPPGYEVDEAALLRDIARAEYALGEGRILDDDDVKQLRPELGQDALLELLEGLETLGVLQLHKVMSESGFAAVRLRSRGWLLIAPALGIDAKGDVERVLGHLAAGGRTALTPGTTLIDLTGDAYRARKVVEHLDALGYVINSRTAGGVQNLHLGLTPSGRRAARAAKATQPEPGGTAGEAQQPPRDSSTPGSPPGPGVTNGPALSNHLPPTGDGDGENVSMRTFVSYSHDTEEHREGVLTLATDLRSASIDVMLDRYVAGGPPQGWPRWMATEIKQARFVLVICTPVYRERAEGRNKPGSGAGANYEGSIINQELYENNGVNEKFVPILLDGAAESDVPLFLRSYQRYRWPEHKEALLRHLTGQPEIVPPPLGPRPLLPRRELHPPGPIVAPIEVSGSFAAELMATVTPAPQQPWRQIEIRPLTAPRVLFRPADFLALVRRAAPDPDLAEGALFPTLTQEPQRRNRGLLWRESSDAFGVDTALAVGFDGSVILRASLREALRSSSPPTWGTQGVGVGSCVDLLVACIAFCDRLLANAAERRPYRLDLVLAGVAGRHLAYENSERVYPLHITRSDEEIIELGGANVPVNATRAAIIEFIEVLLSDLGYHFGKIDLAYVRQRTRARAQRAMRTVVYRYPEGTEIARVGDCAAFGVGSADGDALFAVQFCRSGEVLEPLGLVDLTAVPPHWPQWPKQVSPDLAALIAKVQAALLGEESA